MQETGKNNARLEKARLASLPGSAGKVLKHFIASLLKICGDSVKGVYLTGSLSMGDFYSRKSDIDLVVICTERLNEEAFRKLESMQRDNHKRYPKPPVSGYYFVSDDSKSLPYPVASFSSQTMDYSFRWEFDKILLAELSGQGMTLYGPTVEDLNIQVSKKELLEQISINMNSYWKRWIHKHGGITAGFILLMMFPRFTEWGVLGLARQWYTYNTGKITSKLKAGQFCLETFPEEYKDILSEAIQTRKINRTTFKLSYTRAKKTLALMKYIIREFNITYAYEKMAK